jgi:hypothetical protein
LSANSVRAKKPASAGSHVMIRTRMGRPPVKFMRAASGAARFSVHLNRKSLSFPLPSA